MTEIFGVPTQALFGQLLIGLINGAFYAMLSLGLAVIFGLLNIINFTHGAQYMLGAFCAYFLLQLTGVGYWWSLVLAPIVVGAIGSSSSGRCWSRLYKLDHLYGLLLTFGLAPRTPGLVHQLLRHLGNAVSHTEELNAALQSGLHVPAEVPAWVIVLHRMCLARGS
jgi:branched-chain amino acid transport system permease protein